MRDNQIIAAIDIGSYKIVAALANLTTSVDIIALVEVKSEGIKAGNITNIKLVQQNVQLALEQLQEEANYQIHSVICSFSGIQIQGENFSFDLDIREGLIKNSHLTYAAEAIYKKAIPNDRHLLHYLDQGYVTDQDVQTDEPVGLSANTLSCHSHLISTTKIAYQNLKQIFLPYDIELQQAISSCFSSSIAILDEDEKQIGSCALDIGDSTTDIAIFLNKKIIYSGVIAFGGQTISNDIALFTRSTIDSTKDIKKQINLSFSYDDDDMITIIGINNSTKKEFSKQEIASLIKQSIQKKLITPLINKLNEAGYQDLPPAGFVVCGGCSKLAGFDHFLKQALNSPVRLSEVKIDVKNTQAQSCYANIKGLFICLLPENKTRKVTIETKKGIIDSLKNRLFYSRTK